MEKIGVGFWRWLFPQIHILVLLSTNFLSERFGALAHFSFERAGSVGEKVFFFGLERFRGSRRLKRWLWSFSQKRNKGRHFA
ncbi:hypothetical protein EIB75_13085 [Epilithonimonas vandammei]|uniref:Uncharacterized protein n=1 Tax=Epilithonimonas vandammei TaxID=2487072 RepID=A0A3G8Y2R0_9FLAO|nr:hypothetical protein [Epilithonimonas vandammei]AZI39183.1 hypothetical protein EIB74_04060 [Epilithonimonas vandammei]AZI56134.1 hypothetical protein EIB75_13085 [Epilithonimonas vandammei]